MRLKDIPKYPAYIVCHDCDGAMEVWPADSIQQAKNIAEYQQNKLDEMGIDMCHYRAYEKLPRIKVYKFHPESHK